MKKHLIFIFIIGLLLSFSLSAFEPKGPLRGKNYFIPFLPFYSFPGVGAEGGEKGNLNLSLSQYYIQDIVTEFHKTGTDVVKERFVDYEGYIFEPTVSYFFTDHIETGLTTRLHTYYGGIFDPVFEVFHNLFDFPNGGRESYPHGDVYIHLVTSSGIDLQLDEPMASIGDTDLFMKWNCLSNSYLDLAFFTALKLPTGSMERISGSGYADLAFSFISDFHFLRRFAFYLENGVVIPGQKLSGLRASPPAIYHLMAATEFMATPKLSLLLQFKLNTSTIEDGVIEPINIGYSVKLVKPLTNLQLGAVWTAGPLRMQFFLEEDAFTNNGADLIANFTIGTDFSLF